MDAMIIKEIQSSISNYQDWGTLIEKNQYFNSPEGKKEFFSSYRDLFWKQLIFENELDKLWTKLNRNPTSEEIENLEYYGETIKSIKVLELVDKLIYNLTSFFISMNNKTIKNDNIQNNSINEEVNIDFFTNLSKFYVTFLKESFSTFGLLQTAFKYLPLKIGNQKRVLLFLQNYSPMEWYKFYKFIFELPEIYSSWYFNNYGNLYLNNTPPIDWIKEFFKDPYEKLISEHPEVRIEEKEGEMELLLQLIKELLLELSENDEVSLDTALKTIKEEQPIELVDDEEITGLVRKIVSQLPDFEYIRLKRVFRRKMNQSPNLSFEIDRIINELLKSFEKI